MSNPAPAASKPKCSPVQKAYFIITANCVYANYIVYYKRCVRCARTSYYVEYDVVLYPLCEVGFPAVCFTRTSATSLRNRKLRFKTSCLRTHV